MNKEIAADVEILVECVKHCREFGEAYPAAERVEAYLATYDPNNQ